MHQLQSHTRSIFLAFPNENRKVKSPPSPYRLPPETRGKKKKNKFFILLQVFAFFIFIHTQSQVKRCVHAKHRLRNTHSLD